MYNKIEQDLLDNWGHVFEKSKDQAKSRFKERNARPKL